jgi:hypothetical protein
MVRVGGLEPPAASFQTKPSAADLYSEIKKARRVSFWPWFNYVSCYTLGQNPHWKIKRMTLMDHHIKILAVVAFH